MFRVEMARKYELELEIAGWEQGDLREIGFLGKDHPDYPLELSLRATVST